MTKESCYPIVTVNDITEKVTNSFFQEAELHHFTNTPPWTLMMTDAQVFKEQSLLMTTVLLKTSLTRLYCKNLNFQQKLIRPIFR